MGTVSSELPSSSPQSGHTLSKVLSLPTPELVDHVESCNDELAKRSRKQLERLTRLKIGYKKVLKEIEEHEAYRLRLATKYEDKSEEYQRKQNAGRWDDELCLEVECLQLEYEAAENRKRFLQELGDTLGSELDWAKAQEAAAKGRQKRLREEQDDSPESEGEALLEDPLFKFEYLDPHPLEGL